MMGRLRLCVCSICCHILIQVGDGVALGLQSCCGEGDACRRCGIYAKPVVDVIGVKASGDDLVFCQALCELVDDGSHHF